MSNSCTILLKSLRIRGGVLVFNILVVEDDSELRGLYCAVLTKNRYNVFGAVNGDEALDILDREYIDLIISDIMMPGMDGFELTRTLREAEYNLPILMITAKDSFYDKKQGFAAGTDDYMVKPIDINEMVLRVEALLRRSKSVSERKQVIGDTALLYDSLVVKQKGQSIELPQKEFYLLYMLASFPNRIFTRQQIMDEIWGMDSETDARTVDVHINRLRDRFRDSEDFEIVTVRGLGYKVVKKQ